jgi:hypothetical protein
MLMPWCHGGAGIVILPDMDIMKVLNTVPCESRLISKQDVSYKLCVYNAFCEKPLANTTLARWSGGVRACLHSLDVVWVKWLFMENSPDKGNTDTFSSCYSSHTGSGIFFHSSHCVNLSKADPYLSGHWFLDIIDWGIFTHLIEYCNPLKPVIHF